MERINKLGQELRSAVLCHDLDRVDALVPEYAEAVAQAWNELQEDQRSQSVPQQSMETLAWARDMIVIQRAFALEQLAILQKANSLRTIRARRNGGFRHPG